MSAAAIAATAAATAAISAGSNQSQSAASGIWMLMMLIFAFPTFVIFLNKNMPRAALFSVIGLGIAFFAICIKFFS